MQTVCDQARIGGTSRSAPPSNLSGAEIGVEMTHRTRSAFLTAPAVLTITLTAAVSACGSVTAPRSAHLAADPGGGTTSVPRVARRVQCPAVFPVVRLPDIAQPYVSVQPNSQVQPDGPGQAMEPIPAGFRPVAVVECVTVTSLHHGVFRTERVRRAAVTGLGRLLAELRKPTEPRPREPLQTCLVPATSWPWFVLVGASGQVIRPVTPVGLCGQPLEPLLADLNSLHWIRLGTIGLRPVMVAPPLHGGPVHDITPGITLPG